MKLVKASYEILEPNLDWRGDGPNASPYDNGPKPSDVIYKQIERAGRTCYKSEDKITPESAEKFVRSCVKRGHEAMLEHASMTVKFICDRGISHEIVRHRIASYAQESTRYCNYCKEKFDEQISVIPPYIFQIKDNKPEWCDTFENVWSDAMRGCEGAYMILIKNGVPPEWARSVLPNSLKTEIIVTMNMRGWRHFLKLRAAGTTGKPHPQMQEIAVPLLKELREKLPALFDDIPLPEENAI